MSANEPRPPPPEPVGVHTRKVALIGAAALLLFTVATVVQWLAMRGWEREPRAPVPAEVGRAEIGRVNQQPFEQDTRAETLRRRQRERLTTYGWVDRDARLIHIPVEDAMRQVLTEEGAR